MVENGIRVRIGSFSYSQFYFFESDNTRHNRGIMPLSSESGLKMKLRVSPKALKRLVVHPCNRILLKSYTNLLSEFDGIKTTLNLHFTFKTTEKKKLQQMVIFGIKLRNLGWPLLPQPHLLTLIG